MEMDLAPYTAFGAAVLARIPLAFTLHLDPRAVDQQVQWTLRPPMRDVHGKGLLATADRAEISHIPVQSSPVNRSRLSTKPPRHGHSDQWRSHGSICRSAMPKRTFIVRQVWTAASL